MNEQIIPVHLAQSLLLFSKLQINIKLCNRDLTNSRSKHVIASNWTRETPPFREGGAGEGARGHKQVRRMEDARR